MSSLNVYQNETLFEPTIAEMLALKKAYDQNPYIFIKGFDMNIGIPPSVTISLEFKQRTA